MKPTFRVLTALAASLALAPAARASEADLVLPDLRSVNLLGTDGHSLLLIGLLVCLFGLAFGLMQYRTLRAMKVHKSMAEISELIYETCKTYLITQGKFIIILEALIAVIIVAVQGFGIRDARLPAVEAAAESIEARHAAEAAGLFWPEERTWAKRSG